MKKERAKIPNQLKEYVRQRQNGLCACCLERGEHFHHVIAVGIDQSNQLNYKNLVLLCKHHHTLFHQGDPDTYASVYEYAWYIQHGELPENKDIWTISHDVCKTIKGIIEK